MRHAPDNRRMPKARCTQEAIQTAVELKKRGVMDKDIAAALLVRPDTFSKWINHPVSDNQRQLSQELKRVETDYKASLLTIIYNAGVNGQWQAAAWMLERKYPEEYARRERSTIDAKVQQVPQVVDDL